MRAGVRSGALLTVVAACSTYSTLEPTSSAPDSGASDSGTTLIGDANSSSSSTSGSGVVAADGAAPLDGAPSLPPPGVATLVQSVVASGAISSIKFTQALATGNRVIIGVVAKANTAPSAIKVGTELARLARSSSSPVAVAIWTAAPVAPAEEVNLDFTGGVSSISIVLTEWSGVGAPDPFAAGGTKSDTSLLAATNMINPTPGALLFGVAGVAKGKPASAQAPFVSLAAQMDGDIGFGAAFLVPTSPEPRTMSWPIDVNATWSVAAVQFPRK